ncbi:MAG: LysM peptidoglycan-binding domain-containing protein [Alistipes sp.]|nr:LysM peptidoglycan-binding domain-containing protein [Alistipes sp.]
MKRLIAVLALLMVVWGSSAIEKSRTIVYINGTKYHIHLVAQGETMYALAKAYGVSEAQLVEHNPQLKEGLKADEKIKIPVTVSDEELPMTAKQRKAAEKKLRKTYTSHYVVKGQTLYAIARLYEISVETLLEDNPNLDPAQLTIGERILVRKKEIGTATDSQNEEQMQQYAEQVNAVSHTEDYHAVVKGDTFYSLSKRYGITEEELSRLNGGLQPSELKIGQLLKVPAAQKVEVEQPVEAPAVPEVKEEEHTDKELVINFRTVCNCDPLKVSLLLPMSVDGRPNSNYLDFYQGFLLGLDSLRVRHGYSTEVDLYDTKRSVEEVERIVENDRFRRSQLIIGPVYEEEVEVVLPFAEEKQLPMVTPLAAMSRLSSDALFQMAPDPDKKYAKAEPMIDGKRITFIYTESTDKEFEAEMLALVGDRPYQRHVYKYVHPSVKFKEDEVHPSDLTPILDNDEENIFVIMADNEIDVDRILAALASADTNMRARSLGTPRYSVLGNARWNRYPNIDRTIFFKNNVSFFTTYHAKRDTEVVINFDRSYLRAFGSLPSLYAYRGYDAAMIFVAGMYNDIEYDMEDRRYVPLRTPYRFEQQAEHTTHRNVQWVRVSYNNNFTITVE